jgi:nuclear transport factor 2 (NTF2) superfamily protein
LQDVRSFAERYTAAWCSQDPAQVASFFAPDGSLTINGGEASVGRAAITRAAAEFMTAFPDMRVLMDALEPSVGRTIYRWILVGTNAATGKRVRIGGYEDWRLGEDGLIAESLGHFDASEYARQVEHGV